MQRTMTSKLLDISLGIAIWLGSMIVLGFLGRVMWECLVIGWELLG